MLQKCLSKDCLYSQRPWGFLTSAYNSHVCIPKTIALYFLSQTYQFSEALKPVRRMQILKTQINEYLEEHCDLLLVTWRLCQCDFCLFCLLFGSCYRVSHLVWCLIHSGVCRSSCPGMRPHSRPSILLLGTTVRSCLADLFTQKALGAILLMSGIYIFFEIKSQGN